MNLPKLVARARECLSGKSRSYVQDAREFARAVILLEETNVNLSAVQARCTELLEEVRYLRNPLFNPMPKRE
jgi:hypothetical protein